MDAFTLHRGTAPLLISVPHDGTEIPAAIAARMTPAARRVADTDWHAGRLYAFATELGASLIQPRFSRYVVDLNRPPDGQALYPGQQETGLCPTVTFAGEAIYPDGQQPGEGEIAQRVDRYWRPYHAALQQELARLKARHGRVVLWEGHTIRSVVPMFFNGQLPDLNLGTADGSSCGPVLRRRLLAVLGDQQRYSWVVDGRFKGGHITRHYGRPSEGVEAVQLEIAQCAYMDEASFAFDAERAASLQPVLRSLLERCL